MTVNCQAHQQMLIPIHRRVNDLGLSKRKRGHGRAPRAGLTERSYVDEKTVNLLRHQSADLGRHLVWRLGCLAVASREPIQMTIFGECTND